MSVNDDKAGEITDYGTVSALLGCLSLSLQHLYL